MKEKQMDNDALVAFISAPDASLKDYLLSGLTAANTQLLQKDEYKSLPGVRKLFTDENGVFDEGKFDLIYDLASKKYFELTDQEALNNLLEWSPTSRYKPIGAKTYDTSYSAGTGNNPTRQSIGITGLNQYGPEKYTEKELAQMGKVWDSESGKWIEGATAESRGIGKKIFGETLVYAKYDKDGMQINPITGQEEFHRAGEWMTDENGNYFTMTIGKENLGRKEVVALGDILTKEDSWLNNVDFFDSDEKDKSIAGVAVKTAFQALPYLIPGVQEYYGALTALGGLMSVMPTFYKSMERALLGQSNYGLSDEATQIENWFRKFSTGLSQTGQESFFSFESLGNLLADVFGQLHQQKAAAKLANLFYKIPEASEIAKLSGAEWQNLRPIIEKYNRLGSSLSLGYMGLTQAADVYNDAINAGYDERTAGLASLASAGALFGIMNFNETTRGLGNWFLKTSTGFDHEVSRRPIIEYAKKMYGAAQEATEQAIKNHNYVPMNKFMGDFWANTKSWMQDAFIAKSEDIWKNMIVEGVEEVSEEVIQDMVKGVTDLLSSMGFTAKQGSFGGWDNVFSKQGAARYFQTLVGGALGGGLFSVQSNIIDPYMKRRFVDPNYRTDAELQTEKDIIDILLKGRGDELVKELENLKSIFNTRKGAVGFTDEHGEIHDLRADGQETLADMIVDALVGKVRAIEQVIKGLTGVDSFGQLNEYQRLMVHLQFANDKLEEIFSNTYKNQLASTVQAYEDWQAAKSDSNSETRNDAGLAEGNTDQPSTRITEKDYKDHFESELEKLRNFFNGKEAAARSIQGSLIHRRQLLPSLMGLTDIETWFRLMYHTDTFNTPYSELEEGTDQDLPTMMTKRNIEKLFREYQLSFQLNNAEEVARIIPTVTKLYVNTHRLIKDDEELAAELQHKTEFLKAFNEYDPAKIFEEYTDNLALEALFDDDELEDLSHKSAEEKDLIIRERKSQKAQQFAASANKQARLFRSAAIANIIRKNPFAFSNRERINFDLASILESKGVIDLSGFNAEQQKIFKMFLNQVVQDSGLMVFNEDTLRELEKSLNEAFQHSDNLFIRALKDAGDEETSDEAFINTALQATEDWDYTGLVDGPYNYKLNVLKQLLEIDRLSDEELENYFQSQHETRVPEDIAGDAISRETIDQLNTELSNLELSWDTLDLDSKRQQLKNLYQKIVDNTRGITNKKEIELVKIRGIEDIIGTDTVIDKKLYDQIRIAFEGEIVPVLLKIAEEFNKLCTNPEQEGISFGTPEMILKLLGNIDLANLNLILPTNNREAKKLLAKFVNQSSDEIVRELGCLRGDNRFNQVSEAANRLGNYYENVDISTLSPELAENEIQKHLLVVDLVEFLFDTLGKYNKILRGRTIREDIDPIKNALKKIYFSLHGSSQGSGIFDYLADTEHEIRTSDVTGDSIIVKEEDRKGIKDAFKTINFMNAIFDGAIKYGSQRQDLKAKNVNEIYNLYQQLYGDVNDKLATLDVEDGLWISNYLGELYSRLERLQQVYSELDKSKTKLYEEYRRITRDSWVKLLRKGLRRIHINIPGIEDKEYDLLEGIEDGLLEAETSENTLLKLEELLSTNLHTIYEELSKKDLSNADELFVQSIVDGLLQILVNGQENPIAEALFSPTYGWDSIGFSAADELTRLSVPYVALRLLELTYGYPRKEKNLLDSIYNDPKNSSISPRIDQEQALVHLDFALEHSDIQNYLNKAIRKVANDRGLLDYKGDPLDNIYTVFGTGGSGKTLLIALLNRKYGDSKKLVVSAKIDEKLKDLIDLTEKSDYKRSGKLINDYFSKLEELDQSMESAIIEFGESLIRHLKTTDSKVHDEFIANPASFNEGFISKDESNHIFTFKLTSGEGFEFEFTFRLDNFGPNVRFDALNINVTAVPEESIATNGLEDESILIIDEMTQLSPVAWKILAEWADKHNGKIIALGDPMQKGWHTNGKLNGNQIKLDTQHFALSNVGNLAGAWRSDCTALRETVDILYRTLYESKLFSEGYGTAIFGEKEGEIDEFKEKVGSIVPLTYTTNSTAEGFPFLGSLVTEDDGKIKSVITQINESKAKSKVIIVNDGTNIDKVKLELKTKYPDLADWEVLPISKVQGKEFDYTIIYHLVSQGDVSLEAQDLFTSLTRAKKGQLIITLKSDENDLFKRWNMLKSTFSNSISTFKEEGRDNIASVRAQEIKDLFEKSKEIIPVSKPPIPKEEGESLGETNPGPTGPNPGISSDEDPMELYDQTLNGAKSDKAREIADTWRRSGFTDASGIGQWYTRLGISENILFNRKYRAPITNESEKLEYQPWVTQSSGTVEINGISLNPTHTIGDFLDFLTKLNKNQADDRTDLNGFLFAIFHYEQLDENSKKIFDNFIKNYYKDSRQTVEKVRNKDGWRLSELIDMFEAFKFYSFEHNSEFDRIFAGEFISDPELDYPFRKFNDNESINATLRIGGVIGFTDPSLNNVYITWGTLGFNPQDDAGNFASETQAKKVIRLNREASLSDYQSMIFYRKPGQSRTSTLSRLDGNVKKRSAFERAINLSDSTASSGIYQVGSGIDMRFKPDRRLMNARFGLMEYDRMSLAQLLQNGYEIVKLTDEYFENGLYKPKGATEESKKENFLKLIEKYRWQALDRKNTNGIENFYDDPWILIKKVGQSTPILVRVAATSESFKTDTTSWDSETYLTFSRYKHRSLIEALTYFTNDFDLYSEFKKLDDKLTCKELTEYEPGNIDSLFDPLALQALNEFFEKLKNKLPDNIKSEFEVLKNSYIAKLKWNSIWHYRGEEIRKGGYNLLVKSKISYLKDDLGITSEGRSGLLSNIIRKNTDSISHLIEFINKNMPRFFYDNTNKYNSIGEIEADRNIIVYYTEECPLTLIDWTVWSNTPNPSSTESSTGNTESTKFKDFQELVRTIVKAVYPSDIAQYGNNMILDENLPQYEEFVNNVVERISEGLSETSSEDELKQRLKEFLSYDSSIGIFFNMAKDSSEPSVENLGTTSMNSLTEFLVMDGREGKQRIILSKLNLRKSDLFQRICEKISSKLEAFDKTFKDAFFAKDGILDNISKSVALDAKSGRMPIIYNNDFC